MHNFLPNLNLPDLKSILPNIKSIDYSQFSNISESLRIPPNNTNIYADTYYDRLMDSIVEFEKELNEDEQTGGMFVGFSNTLINFDSISCYNPGFIIYHGKFVDTQKRVQLIQHYTQISVALVAVPRINKDVSRIGYDYLKSKTNDN